MSNKPPLTVPRWMVEAWGLIPLPPDGYTWEVDFTRDVLVARPLRVVQPSAAPQEHQETP